MLSRQPKIPKNLKLRKFPGKNAEIVEFPKRKPLTIQPKVPEILGGKSDGMEITAGRKFPKILEYLARSSSFPEILENAVPFAAINFFNAENFQKFKPEFLIEWSDH